MELSSDVRLKAKRMLTGLAVTTALALASAGAASADPGGNGALVNAAVIVRDVDAGEAQETALATAKIERRGAPFEMGWLHLGRWLPAAENRRAGQRPR